MARFSLWPAHDEERQHGGYVEPTRAFSIDTSHTIIGGVRYESRRYAISRRRISVCAAVRQFHRRRVGAAGARRILRQRVAYYRRAVYVDPAIHARRRRTRPRCRAPCAQSLGRYRTGRARHDPQPDRGSDGAEPFAYRVRRIDRQRQADPRNTRRGHPARHRPRSLFRRLHSCPGRDDLRDRRRHRRLSFPRAARRSRSSFRGISRS